MHNQVLVIYPSDVELDDIMYWYQEIDKTQDDKMNDERCQFLLTFKEEEIPKILNSNDYFNKYDKKGENNEIISNEILTENDNQLGNTLENENI